MSTFVNIIAYQGAWFACVIGAANDVAWIGTALSLTIVFAYLIATTDVRAEIELIAVALILGLLIDSALASSGQIGFAAGGASDRWAPHWMLALWAAFATTLNRSLRWVIGRPIVAAAFGALGGPLAYFAGTRLGALQMPTPEIALPLIAACWAAAMLILSAVARSRRSSTEPQLRTESGRASLRRCR
jgi:Protein of unknown function (DUF2878)